MPNVYTRTGDQGLTGLFGGSRVPKQDPVVEAYGTVDEASTAIGEAKATCTDEATKAQLHHIQQRLFTLAAELASDAMGREVLDGTIDAGDVTGLERLIDDCLAETGPQRSFVVPGRDLPSAALHRARAITRRAERRVLTLAETRPVRPELIKYLNRLSDALYALARLAEHRFELARVETVVREVVGRVLGSGQVENDAASYDLTALKLMAEAAEAKARELGVPIVFAGVDASGDLILLHRMADSLLVGLELAVNKAFTAAALRMPTSELAALGAPDGALAGIGDSHGGRLVLFGGGVPVYAGGRFCGGIGVSGGTVDEDIEIVSSALNALQKVRQP